MSAGRRASSDMYRFKNKSGVTLVEMIVAMLVMTVVFLAVAALFVVHDKFYSSENDRVIIGYELNYAIEHICTNAIQGIGDRDNPAIVITPAEREVIIRQIDDDDPDTPPTYSDFTDDKEIIYTITNDGELSYSKRDLSSGLLLEEDTDMIPSVVVLYSNDPVSGEQLSRFYMNGKTLCVKLTAQFPSAVRQEQKTLYGSCFSRLNVYN
jgi:prepilin-type N-terminal cleavage/methylation domain-containing protein